MEPPEFLNHERQATVDAAEAALTRFHATVSETDPRRRLEALLDLRVGALGTRNLGAPSSFRRER